MMTAIVTAMVTSILSTMVITIFNAMVIVMIGTANMTLYYPTYMIRS